MAAATAARPATSTSRSCRSGIGRGDRARHADQLHRRHALPRGSQEELEQSKHELETAYEELQSTNEELETTNEELQSTNEELETTNEELQSTNEELETMNEELQSTNEELRRSTPSCGSAATSSTPPTPSWGPIITGLETASRWWIPTFRSWPGTIGRRTCGASAPDEVVGRNLLNLDIGLPVDQLRQPVRTVLAEGAPQVRAILDATSRRGKRIRCAGTRHSAPRVD